MKKTVKFLALCLALVMVFSLAACGSESSTETTAPDASLPTASTAAR